MALETARINTNKPDEIDVLQKKFASKKIEDEDKTDSAEEKEPKSSGSTPDAPRTPNLTADGRKLMFVAAKSKVKFIAGSVAKTVRDNKEELPVLSAVGAASVNQAVKAIAIARDFIKDDDFELGVEVSREPQNEVRDVIVLSLTKHEKDSLLPKMMEEEDEKENEQKEWQDLRSSSQGTAPGLAGAIAMNIRNGKKARITAIGQVPVFKAVSAIVLARKYLKKDNLDIIMVPKFTQVKFENGKDANAVQIFAIAKTIPGEQN